MQTGSGENSHLVLRKIIHCDCDCFFAAVEMRDDLALRDVPVAVGGSADRRGVIATCNYAARDYGVRSAMATGQAVRLCPSLVVIPPDFVKYKLVAEEIRAIFRDFTERIEPLSLDEAFLDVSECGHFRGSATRIAQAIRERVRTEVGITVSAGVAPNKFLAKIASDWRKPDGIFVITPEEVNAFVATLPVAKLFGVGKVTANRLQRLGIQTCGELRSLEWSRLTAEFGAFGGRLYDLCRGIDDREVRSDRRRKTLSIETTYATDLADLAACLVQLANLCASLEDRLRSLRGDSRVSGYPVSEYRIAGQFVKIRFDDFTATTVARASKGGVCFDGYRALCEEAWHRGNGAVRLLGVGVRFADRSASDDGQLPLF